MSQSVGGIFVELGLNFAAFTEGLSKATYRAKEGAREISRALKSAGGGIEELSKMLGDFGGVIGETFGTAGRLVGEFANHIGRMDGAGIALAGVGAGAIAAAGAAATLAVSGAELIEKIENLSKKTGIARDSLLGWTGAAKASGVSMESFAIGLRHLEVGMEGIGVKGKIAKQILSDLGISTRDPQEALLQLADAYKNMDDDVKRAAISQALFGKSGVELVPVLSRGRDEIEKWQKVTKEMGLTIDDGAVKSAEHWKESVTKLGLQFDTARIKMVGLLDAARMLIAAGMFQVTWDTDLGYKLGVEFAKKFNAGARQGVDTSKIFEGLAKHFDFKGDASRQQVENATKFFDLVKAGGPREAELEATQKEISEQLKLGTASSIARATSLEKQIPLLEKQAALEKSARESAEKRALSYKDVMSRIGQSIAPYSPKSTQKRPDSSGLFGPQPSAAESIEAPDLTLKPQMPSLDMFAPAPMLQTKDVFEEFSNTFKTSIDEDTEHLNKLKTEFEELAKVGAIDGNQLATAMAKIGTALKSAQFEKDQEALAHLKKDLQNSNSFADQFKAMGLSLQMTSLQIKQSLASIATQGLEQFNQAMARFIVTGQGGFKAVLQSMAESLIQLGLQLAEAAIFKKVFDAAFATSTAAQIAGTEAIRQSAIGAAAATAAIEAAVGGPEAAIIAAIVTEGALQGITALAGGGDTVPGRSYLVGEKGPEIFSPGSGHVFPNSTLQGNSGGSGGHTFNHTTVINTVDAAHFGELLEKHASTVARHVNRQFRLSGVRA